MEKHFTIKEPTMQRVRVVYFLRKLMWPTLLEAGILCTIIGVSTLFVSFSSVLANARVVSRTSLINYLVGVVANTGIAEQLMLLVIVLSLGYFLWRTTKAAKVSWWGSPVRA